MIIIIITITITHHIPDVVSEPVDDRIESADELQMLRLDGALVNEEQDETGRDERHGNDDENGDKDVRSLKTGI